MVAVKNIRFCVFSIGRAVSSWGLMRPSALQYLNFIFGHLHSQAHPKSRDDLDKQKKSLGLLSSFSRRGRPSEAWWPGQHDLWCSSASSSWIIGWRLANSDHSLERLFWPFPDVSRFITVPSTGISTSGLRFELTRRVCISMSDRSARPYEQRSYVQIHLSWC